MKEIKIYTSINSSCSTLFMIIARANLNWGQTLNMMIDNWHCGNLFK
jgi:hypothetical protein